MKKGKERKCKKTNKLQQKKKDDKKRKKEDSNNENSLVKQSNKTDVKINRSPQNKLFLFSRPEACRACAESQLIKSVGHRFYFTLNHFM